MFKQMLVECFSSLGPFEIIGLSFLIAVTILIVAYCFMMAIYLGRHELKRLFKRIWVAVKKELKGKDEVEFDGTWMDKKKYKETQ